MIRIIFSLVILFGFSFLSFAAEKSRDEFEFLINQTRNGCTATYGIKRVSDIQIAANGDLSLKFMKKGIGGESEVIIKREEHEIRGQTYIDERLRKELDNNTVKCMAPYIEKIFKWYLQEDDISLDGKSLGSFSNTASIKFRDGYINSIEKEVCYMFHNDRRRLIGVMKFSKSNPRVSLQLKSKFDEIILTEVLENEIEKKNPKFWLV
jgi:hypothetical protein